MTLGDKQRKDSNEAKGKVDDFSLEVTRQDMLLVDKIAISLYSKRFDDSVPFEDYRQYGMVGLLESKKRFKADRKASFATYSTYRIRGAILNGVVKHAEKLNHYAYKKKQNSERLKFITDNIDDVNKDEVDELLDVFIELTGSLAISALLDGMSEAEMLVDDTAASYYQSQLSTQLLDSLKSLSDDVRLVITYHYFGSLNFSDIADILKLSKGRVSQLHKQGLFYLRNELITHPNYSDLY